MTGKKKKSLGNLTLKITQKLMETYGEGNHCKVRRGNHYKVRPLPCRLERWATRKEFPVSCPPTDEKRVLSSSVAHQPTKINLKNKKEKRKKKRPAIMPKPDRVPPSPK